MYRIMNEEGEELGQYDTMEDVVKELQGVRDEVIADERDQMERYPEHYEEGYDPAQGMDEYMAENYEVIQVLPFPDISNN